MHEYNKIKQQVSKLLLKNGVQEEIADQEVDYYGSIQSIFASESHRFMVFWDGEEGYGGVEMFQGNGQWKMLNPIIPEANESEFGANISVLLQTINRMF